MRTLWDRIRKQNLDYLLSLRVHLGYFGPFIFSGFNRRILVYTITSRMEENFVKLMAIIVGAGIIGSVIGAVVGVATKDKRLRIGTAAGVGFLIGAVVGATAGVFASLTGNL